MAQLNTGAVPRFGERLPACTRRPAGGGNSREVGGGLVRLFVRLHSVSWPKAKPVASLAADLVDSSRKAHCMQSGNTEAASVNGENMDTVNPAFVSEWLQGLSSRKVPVPAWQVPVMEEVTCAPTSCGPMLWE